MREDCINVATFALLTFPSTAFNLENLVSTIGPHLTDQKKRVRQASIECIALLSQCLGPTKVKDQVNKKQHKNLQHTFGIKLISYFVNKYTG